MPFDPDFPFVPADPSQWWQARGLPRILVQPNAPANAGSTNPAGSDGIDDWFVPTPAPEQDGLLDDWFVPGNAGGAASSPGDPSNPNNANVPAPAAAPNPSAPNLQSSAATPSPSNQPAPRPDPFAAYWSLIPASRAGAMAWHPPIFLSPDPLSHENIPASAWVTPPPIFLNSPGQPPFPGPAPLDYSLPAYGLFRGIAKMSAASAPPDLGPPSAAHGMFGGIAKRIAASAAPDPLSLSGSRGFLGSLAHLPVPPSAQAASYGPYSGPFLPSDPTGFQGGGPLPDIELIADKTKGPRNVDLFDERAFGESPPLGSAAPRLVPPFGDGPRLLARPPLAPPTPPSLSGPMPTSPGQDVFGSRPSGTPIAPAPAVPKPAPISEQPRPANAVAGVRNVAPPESISEEGRPAPAIPEWRQYELEKGSQQTILRTTYQGKDIKVVLDFPPNKDGIVDLKKYNWWKPGYMVPFLQGKVAEKFQIQIQKYRTIDPMVKFKFSAEPPRWVVQALEQVGGTYIVDP